MAAGYSGMAEAPDSADGAQASIYYVSDEYCQDGDTVTLADADGNVIAEYAFAHGFNCVVLSSPELTVGESYTLTMGDLEPVTIELTDTVYSNRGGMMGFFGSGEPSGES